MIWGMTRLWRVQDIGTKDGKYYAINFPIKVRTALMHGRVGIYMCGYGHGLGEKVLVILPKDNVFGISDLFRVVVHRRHMHASFVRRESTTRTMSAFLNR